MLLLLLICKIRKQHQGDFNRLCKHTQTLLDLQWQRDDWINAADPDRTGELKKSSEASIIFLVLLVRSKHMLKTSCCFINKHDQIINQFSTGEARLADQVNEHDMCVYMHIHTTPIPEKLGHFVKCHKIKNMLFVHSL